MTGIGFCGYRYRFGLYAAHSNIMNSEEDAHFHNFTISLYIHAANGEPDDNFKVERIVQDWLKPFQGQYLAQMELFTGKETTVEGMGKTFFDPLCELIENQGYELVKLEIFENPIRVYVVSNKRLDSIVNEISSIPLECFPLIQLDGNEKSIDNDKVDINNNEIIVDNKELPVEAIILNESEDKLFEGYEDLLIPAEEILKEESAVTLAPKLDDMVQEQTQEKIKNSLAVHSINIVLTVLKLLVGIACFTSVAVATMYIVKTSGRYPQGSDTFCHLYRADLILDNIKQGNWYPLYDSSWYNGVEIMRYWGPIPLYLIAGLEWILHINVLDAYVVFLGVLILLGGCGWLLWGITYKRTGIAIFIGMIWFYMPENMRVVIYEGNLPRGVINALLPFYFYFLWKVMEDKKRKAILPLMFVTALITLCHLGITLMLIATSAIFIIIYAKMNHSIRASLCALGTSIAGVLSAGVWVVPSLIGGAASGSSTNQVMKYFFESALVSLNPFIRWNGDALSFYFGLSVFIVCILGIVFGTQKVKPGFITALILFLCTTKSTYTLFSKLPFSQFLWMIRFIPIALAVAMVSFILWKQLRKWMVLLLGAILIVDCATSYQYIYFPEEERIEDIQADMDAKAESLLLTEAKEITNQRVAVLDLSKYGSFAPYYITGVGKSVNYTFGAGWEGASTATNIVNLNMAVENGWYVYLFDRALELGNDTVLIPIQNLKEKSKDVDRVITAANISGYNLADSNGSSLLFHKDTVKQFGVVTEYKNIAIGTSSSGIAMILPIFKEASKNNINDYTFEELSKYHTIYLSGFTYDDKHLAEELLLKLSESGVQIYIDMNNAPVDRAKKQIELFGVNAQSITFTETFPGLEYHRDTYISLDYNANINEWNTVYLDGLDQAEGYYSMVDSKFPFIGTAYNENLHFIGLNLIYYLQTTRDSEIQRLVEAIFGMAESITPNRNVVPISIQTWNDRIEISSEYDNVNTTLSSIDILSSKDNYRTDNNLVIVDSGRTVIDIGYPHRIKGILVTCVGIMLSILTYLLMKKKRSVHNE